MLMRPFAWRLRASNVAKQIEDAVAGTQACNVTQELGDFVVAKVDGGPAYQLAVVVDDHAMGVTEVVRGDDLLPSAFRQLELYDFFGGSRRSTAHVPVSGRMGGGWRSGMGIRGWRRCGRRE